MLILGIDPGSHVCGYGAVVADEQGENRYVECGVLTAPRSAPLEERLGEIAISVKAVIEDLQPEAVAVEDVFTHQNVRSAVALAQARGAILAVVGMASLPVYSYAPAMVKKYITGRGQASKEQVALMVQALIGLRTLPALDASDALAVALTHARHMRSPL